MTDAESELPWLHRGGVVPRSPAVSIIVLVRQRVDLLARCLDSIRADTASGPVAEVVVLANGTAAGDLRALRERDDIVLIRSAVNHGFGGGCNWAARFAVGERLVFMNDDAVATRGWLAALNAALDDDPGIGVAGSRVLLQSGRLQEAGGVIWRDGSTSHIGRGLPADEPLLLRRRDVDYVSFCSAMVRRATWEGAGGFDERYYPAYYEDADLCLAARSAGWRVVCEPASVVVHDEGASTPVALRHFLSRRNQRLFVMKWNHVLARFPDRPRPDTPHAVMAAALGRDDAVVPATDGGSIPAQRARPARGRRTRRAALDPKEARELELRHLAADVALKEEYITFLAGEIDDFGAATLARRRYRDARNAVVRRARAVPWLDRVIDAAGDRRRDRGHRRRRGA